MRLIVEPDWRTDLDLKLAFFLLNRGQVSFTQAQFLDLFYYMAAPMFMPPQ